LKYAALQFVELKVLGSRILFQCIAGLFLLHCSSSSLLAQTINDARNPVYQLEYGMGMSAQFFGYSKVNSGTSLALSAQDPDLNPQGLGIPLYLNIILRNGWGIEFSPTIRRDHISYRGVDLSRENSVDSWILDHHFSILHRFQAQYLNSPLIGLGFSIISPGQSTDGLISFRRPNSNVDVVSDLRTDFQFSGLHLFMRWDLFRKGILLEPKLLFVPAGNISYKPHAAFTLMHFITVKFALSRWIAEGKSI